jgi:hypothetical protein
MIRLAGEAAPPLLKHLHGLVGRPFSLVEFFPATCKINLQFLPRPRFSSRLESYEGSGEQDDFQAVAASLCWICFACWILERMEETARIPLHD